LRENAKLALKKIITEYLKKDANMTAAQVVSKVEGDAPFSELLEGNKGSVKKMVMYNPIYLNSPGCRSKGRFGNISQEKVRILS
jgi:hypothetical protein